MMQTNMTLDFGKYNQLYGKHITRQRRPWIIFPRLHTGGNRTMFAAATIVSMAAADGERNSILPLVRPNKARCVSFSAPDI